MKEGRTSIQAGRPPRITAKRGSALHVPPQKGGGGLGQLVLHLASLRRTLRCGKDDTAQHVPLLQDGGRRVQGEAPWSSAQREVGLPSLVLIDLPPRREYFLNITLPSRSV